MTDMRVLFVPLYSAQWASSRYRAYYWAEALACAGVSATVLPPARGAARARYYASLLVRAARVDVVVIQKKLFPLPILAALARINPRLVFDFDDALFARPSDIREEAFAAGAEQQARRLHYSLRRARLVVAGNHFLAAYALRINPRVAVIPTAIDLARLPARGPRAAPAQVAIGWTGRSATVGYLDLVAPAISALERRRHGRFVLRVVADGVDRRPLRIADVSVDNIVWTPEAEYTVIDSFDIGIMPLINDDWSRGKCGFKLLQCMARGVPVVASPVGANCEIVQDGMNGLLALDEVAWTDRLATLIDDAALRQRLGQAGLETVTMRYSFDVVIPRLAALLAEVATAAGPPHETRNALNAHP